VNVTPPGCKQLFDVESGSFKSWNDHSGMLANQQYFVCFRLRPGFCSIKFTALSFDVGDVTGMSNQPKPHHLPPKKVLPKGPHRHDNVCRPSPFYRQYKAVTVGNVYKVKPTSQRVNTASHMSKRVRRDATRKENFRCQGSDYIEFPPSKNNTFCGKTFNGGRPLVVKALSPLYVYVNTFGPRHGKGFEINFFQLPCAVN